LTLFSTSWDLAPSNSLIPFKIISAVFLFSILIYFGLKFYTSRIGGIYVGKRIAFGLILACLSLKGGVDENFGLAFLLFLITELTFIALRIFY